MQSVCGWNTGWVPLATLGSPWPPWAPLTPFGASLGPPGPIWAPLEPHLNPLGPPWAPLGPLGPPLGPPWPPWAPLGPLWAPLVFTTNNGFQQYLFIFSFTLESTPDIEPKFTAIRWVKGTFTPGLKRPGTESNHLPSPRAQFKKARSRNYKPPYNFMACKETRLPTLLSRFKALSSPTPLVWLWRLFCVVSCQQPSATAATVMLVASLLRGSVAISSLFSFHMLQDGRADWMYELIRE